MRAEVPFLIAPAGVKASVKEPSVLATGSTGPCQMPWKATTRPGGSGDREPPDRLMSVSDPSVVSQPCIVPARPNEYTRPLSVHSFALPRRVLQPPWRKHPGRPPWAMTPPWRWVNSR